MVESLARDRKVGYASPHLQTEFFLQHAHTSPPSTSCTSYSHCPMRSDSLSSSPDPIAIGLSKTINTSLATQIFRLSLRKSWFYTGRQEEMADVSLLHLWETHSLREGQSVHPSLFPSFFPPSSPHSSLPPPHLSLLYSPQNSSFLPSLTPLNSDISLTSDPQVKSHHLFHMVPSEKFLTGSHVESGESGGSWGIPGVFPSVTQSVCCAFLHYRNHPKPKAWFDATLYSSVQSKDSLSAGPSFDP